MGRRSERREAQRREAKRRNAVRRWRNRALWIIPLIAFTALITYALISSPEQTPFPYGNVHWHSKLDFLVCGEERTINDLGSLGGHYGSSVLHTHGDSKIHLEGNPGFMEEASLGAFFRAVNIPFSDRGIFEYSDGTLCPGSDNSSLKVYVNDVIVQNASAYVPSDGDVIRIVYG